jgi:ABC-2 type transport system ATP-binding protein
MNTAIETSNLTHRYGKTVALDDLNLSIPEGSIYGFIGPNGAGKTTTLRLLAGLLEPAQGEIRLMGTRLSSSGSEAQQLVGYMPDFFGVYDDLRVWEYLDFFTRCYGMPAARRRTTVEQLLDLVDLTPKRDAFVQSLSRGMQQRLCLAHALVHDPPILLLDEPASGLDPRARVELRELLRTLRDMGKTVLISSHILSELAEVSSTIGIIDQGRMVVSGSVQEVRERLRSGKVLRLRVLHGVESAIALLTQLPAHDDLPRILSVQEDDLEPRTLQAEMEHTSEAQQAALLAYLIAQGVAVSDYSTYAEDLEQLFLRITDLAPEAGARA